MSSITVCRSSWRCRYPAGLRASALGDTTTRAKARQRRSKISRRTTGTGATPSCGSSTISRAILPVSRSMRMSWSHLLLLYVCDSLCYMHISLTSCGSVRYSGTKARRTGGLVRSMLDRLHPAHRLNVCHRLTRKALSVLCMALQRSSSTGLVSVRTSASMSAIPPTISIVASPHSMLLPRFDA